MTTGLLYVFTGTGKGKTTAAAGLALRAKSRGLRVLFAQFMKNRRGGEVDLLKSLGMDVVRFRSIRSPLFYPGLDEAEMRNKTIRALAGLRRQFPRYDLMVLDEFVHLLKHRYITREETQDFLAARPESLNVVLTGRGAPAWLVELADLVTDMRNIKHPARRGVTARKGIEY